MLHFLGLAMALGTSFAFMFLRTAGSKMENAEGKTFILNTFSLSRMAHIGLLFLFISGGYLMSSPVNLWAMLGSYPLLIVKLSLFLVLGALIGISSSYAKKAKKEHTDKYLKKISTLGTFSMLVGITIVVLAVTIFH